jgi:hypothetical protein
MLPGPRDRRSARDRLAAERRRLRHARLADQAMPLAVHYRQGAGMRMLPAGPTRCPRDCPWCEGRWAA